MIVLLWAKSINPPESVRSDLAKSAHVSKITKFRHSNIYPNSYNSSQLGGQVGVKLRHELRPSWRSLKHPITSEDPCQTTPTVLDFGITPGSSFPNERLNVMPYWYTKFRVVTVGMCRERRAPTPPKLGFKGRVRFQHLAPAVWALTLPLSPQFHLACTAYLEKWAGEK